MPTVNACLATNAQALVNSVLMGPDGVNLRIYGFSELSTLCERMLRVCPSDTKSMSKLIACTQIMLYQQGVNTVSVK